MKNKFKLYGIIVLVAIIGLSMVACNVGTSPIGNDDPRSSGAPAPTGGDGFVIYDAASGGWLVSNASSNGSHGGTSGLSGVAGDNYQAVFVTLFSPGIQLSTSSLKYSKIVVTLNANSDWAGGELFVDDSGLGTANTAPLPGYHIDDYSTNWRISGQPKLEVPLATMVSGIGSYKNLVGLKVQAQPAGASQTLVKILKIELE